MKADLAAEDLIPAAPSTPAQSTAASPTGAEGLSPSEKVDKFYTFSRKNEEFQQLLNREYDKIRGGNPIEHEQTAADKTAAEKFETRPQDPSMEAFLDREGLNRIYEPKAVETDVLQRIEAQDRKREEERLEEEARLKLLEEERRKAEAEMKAAEEARIAAEEEARRLAEEEARRKAEEEARERALEEAKRKAEEEVKRAEEEARRAAEEAKIAAERQARIEAAEAARLAAEQETARLRAEAELRAQQEAEKIKQQQEARRAILEEEQRKIDEARRKIEEENLRKRMLREQQSIAMETGSAAAAEEARRTLRQTARMKEEEQAKIRAAIAGIRTGASAPEPAIPVEPMPEPVAPAPIPAKPAEADKNAQAHKATQDNLSAMEKARREFLAEFGLDPVEAEKPPEPAPVKSAQHTPATVEELLDEKPVTGRDTMLSESADLTATRVVDKSAVLAGIQNTRAFGGIETLEEALKESEAEPIPEPAAIPVQEPAAEPVVKPAEDAVPDPAEELLTVEDLLGQFEENNIGEGFAKKEEPSIEPEAGSLEDVKPGLDNTMVLTAQDITEEAIPGDFDNYGEKEAAEFRRAQEEAAIPEAMNDFYGEEQPSPLDTDGGDIDGETPEEDEAGTKSGAGRIVLKILLIVLIIIFAAELAGIGIKYLAPNSKAAEFIDNQLNKVIHLITGSETEYSVPGIDYEV